MERLTLVVSVGPVGAAAARAALAPSAREIGAIAGAAVLAMENGHAIAFLGQRDARTDAEARALLEAARTLAAEVRVAAFVRHPVEAAAAHVARAVLSGARLCEAERDPPLLFPHAALEPWRRAAGAAFRVHAYGRDADAAWDIVAAVAQAAGVPHAAAPPSPRQRRAGSPPTIALQLLDAARAHGPLADHARAYIALLDGPAYRLPAEEAARVAATVAPDLAAFEATYGLALRPNPSPVPPGLSPEEASAIAHILCRAADFGEAVSGSALGRLMGYHPPVARQRPGRLHRAARTLGLLRPLDGRVGQRARTVTRRLWPRDDPRSGAPP